MNLSRPAFAFIAAVLAACNCQPPVPTPVGFRIKNTLAWPIFVADEQGQAGIALQLPSFADWVDMTEELPCGCQACEEICRGCRCEPVAPKLRQIKGGASFEREWSGEYRTSGSRSCVLGSRADCFEKPTAAGPGQKWRAKLCFANRLQTPPPADDRFSGTLPEKEIVCVTREFTLPPAQVIELSPPLPASCKSRSECKPGEMCQAGLCSAECLPSKVPPLGPSWTAEVGSPDNQGFFSPLPASSGRTGMTGIGIVGSVRYESGNIRLSVYRDDAAQGRLTGELYLTLPGGRAVPMQAGDPVDITVVESTDTARTGARAAVVRRGSVTLLVLDSGRGGPVLTPDDMQPFSVATEGDIVACDPGNCGRKMHREMTFAAAGKSATLKPGSTATQAVGGYRYEFVPVGNYRYEFEGCGARPVTPFAILLEPGT